LRAFEQQNNLSPARHRIEHVQIIHPDDRTFLQQFGIIASMQPLHATSDMYIADRHWGERSRHAYALNSIVRNDISYAFGSDAPVESPNPFFGLHAAVTRTRPDGSPDSNGWHPDQKISLLEALHGYTTGAAYAGHFEHDLGQLSVGYFADFIVLNQDPFALSPSEIVQLSPQSVAIAGNWVWRK